MLSVEQCRKNGAASASRATAGASPPVELGSSRLLALTLLSPLPLHLCRGVGGWRQAACMVNSRGTRTTQQQQLYSPSLPCVHNTAAEACAQNAARTCLGPAVAELGGVPPGQHHVHHQHVGSKRGDLHSRRWKVEGKD